MFGTSQTFDARNVGNHTRDRGRIIGSPGSINQRLEIAPPAGDENTDARPIRH
jgi:hypothetical protein